jgi:Na+-transporting NADH:ubiquinone oxidoreductase subunit NqrE
MNLLIHAVNMFVQASFIHHLVACFYLGECCSYIRVIQLILLSHSFVLWCGKLTHGCVT